MTVEEALEIVDIALGEKGLSDAQELVFRQSWRRQTYEEIAQDSDYDTVYIRDIGSKLWKLLSKALGQKITKANFQSILRRRAQQASVPAKQSSIALSPKSFNDLAANTTTEFIQESICQIAKITEETKELSEQSEQMTQALNRFVNTNKVI